MPHGQLGCSPPRRCGRATFRSSTFSPRSWIGATSAPYSWRLPTSAGGWARMLLRGSSTRIKVAAPHWTWASTGTGSPTSPSAGPPGSEP